MTRELIDGLRETRIRRNERDHRHLGKPESKTKEAESRRCSDVKINWILSAVDGQAD